MSIPSIGRYRVVRKLGAGGMGQVFLAFDDQLQRSVAIKLVGRHLAGDPDARKGLLREAQAAAQLDHENICAVHEVGDADGQTFIAMAFVEGATLADRLVNRPPGMAEAVGIATQVASALAEAHAHGIVHRDIKPANIIVTLRGQAKVMDFGLAKAVVTTDGDTAEAITAPGLAIGTVPYMSPEQARGEDVDTRSDVFSAAVVLYEMVTGRHPFAAASPADTVAAILRQEPAPLARFANGVPAELERIVAKALAKAPGERYQSTRDFELDLRALLKTMTDGRPLTPAPAVVGGSLGPVARRRRRRETRRFSSRAAWSMGALAILGFAGAAYVWNGHSTAPLLTERDTMLVASFDNTTGDAVFDGALRQALALQLEQSPYLNVFPDQRVAEALRLIGRSADERVTADLAREICQRQGLKAFAVGSIAPLGTGFVLGVEVVNAVSGDVIARGQQQAASKHDVLRAVGRLATGLRGALGEALSSVFAYDTPVERATTQSLESLKLYSQAATIPESQALGLLERAIALDPGFASAYARASVMYGNAGQKQKAVEYAGKAYELLARVSERERATILGLYESQVTGNYWKAVDALESHLRQYPRDAVANNNISAMLNRVGQSQRAIAPARTAIGLRPHPAGYNNLAEALLGLNRLTELQLALNEAVSGKHDTIPTHRWLYQLAFVNGDAAAMRAQDAWADAHAATSAAQLWQADAAAFHGRLAASETLARRASASLSQRDQRENGARALLQLARWQAAYQECPRAVASIDGAQALVPAIDPPQTAAVLATCGAVSRSQALARSAAEGPPQHTHLRGLHLPLAGAALALQSGQPRQAVTLLEVTRPYESWNEFHTNYLRAQALMAGGQFALARAEFQRILDNRGWGLVSPLWALSHLGLARASAARGDTAAARQSYAAMQKIWADADDLALVRAARREAERLVP